MKTQFKKLAAAVAAVSFLYGCSFDSEKKSETDIFAMDTYMHLTAYGNNSDNAVKAAESEIYRLEKLLSVTDESSEVYMLNNSDGGRCAVSDDVLYLAEYAKNISVQTDNALNITVYPVLKEWGFTGGDYKIPEKDILKSLIEQVDSENISAEADTVQLKNNAEIDFGALAKGYASEKVCKLFRENGISSGIISLGGNVAAIGNRPDGTPWNVAVTNPFDTEEYLGLLKISDSAVITSGNYERYFTGDDGKRYCHIIDPATGYPVDNGLVSVTVIGKDSLLCDAMSTALFVMGKEKAVSYWKSEKNFDMIIVESDGNISVTEGISGSFENLSDFSSEVLYDED